MNDLPLVSIVTPSLNQGRWLPAAITSVRAQTYPRVEHVVVDGGSSDETLEILRANEGVRWMSEPDRGQSHALNKGFALAQGEILGWLNADDAYEPDAVAAAVAALRESATGLVYADVTRVDDDAKTIRRYDEFWPERLAVSRRHGGRLVSPLLIRRYVRGGAQPFVLRAVGGIYALAGKRR